MYLSRSRITCIVRYIDTPTIQDEDPKTWTKKSENYLLSSLRFLHAHQHYFKRVTNPISDHQTPIKQKIKPQKCNWSPTMWEISRPATSWIVDCFDHRRIWFARNHCPDATLSPPVFLFGRDDFLSDKFQFHHLCIGHTFYNIEYKQIHNSVIHTSHKLNKKMLNS